VKDRRAAAAMGVALFLLLEPDEERDAP